MVIMEPCGRLRIILTQMVENIVGSANPANEKEYERLMNVVIPDLEKRAYQLAGECRALGGCEGGMCDTDVIRKIFEKANYDLEERYLRYKESAESGIIKSETTLRSFGR